MMKRVFLALVVAGMLFVSAAAETAPAAPMIPGARPDATGETLDLALCLGEAASKGDEAWILARTLDAARFQHAINAAKAGISLSASGGYSLDYGFDDATLAKKAGATSGLGLRQGAAGSLSLARGTQSASNPFTKVSLSASHSFSPPSVDASPVSSVGLAVVQILWDGYPGGQTGAAVEKSILALRAKELAAAQGRSAAAAKVKLAYVAVLSAQRALAVRRSNQEKQNSLLSQMRAIYDLEQASAVDLASASINARSAELDVKSGEKDLRSARLRLANLMGRPGDTPFSVAEIEEPALPAATLDEAIAAGLAKRADAAQLELARRSAAIDLAVARAQAGASVSLSAGIDAIIDWGSETNSGEAANLGVKLGMPVLDAGSSRNFIEACSAQVEIYDAQARQLARAIAADIRDYYETALIQADRVDLAKSSMELARAQFEVIRTQNQFGTATNQDMLTASVAAATAEAAYATARSAYLTAVIQLETAMGL
jgi:outer membrane protein TolC